MQVSQNFLYTERWASPTEPFRDQWRRVQRDFAHGWWDMVEGRCRAILRVWPRAVMPLHMLGLVARRRGMQQEALALFDEVLAIDPRHVEALIDSGNALAAIGETERALARFDAALAVEPGHAAAHYDRGLTLVRLGRDAEAAGAFERAATLAPAGSATAARAGVNWASALAASDRDEEAEARAREALARTPDAPEASVALALILLKRGRFEEGWPLYEHRLRLGAGPDEAGAARWTGAEEVAGRRVLLRHEQGLGDTIQFARYAPLLAARGATVIVQAPPALVPLLRSLGDGIEVVGTDEPAPAHDVFCYMGSLPGAFGTRADTIPAAIPYLAADPARVAAWRDRLGARLGEQTGEKRRVRVGLAWSGSAENVTDARRSMPAAHLAPLLARDDLACFALQPGVSAEDQAALAAHPEVAAHRGRLTDFAETAALASLMDVVVSVDTSVAHLAGALGRPLWMLLPTGAEWRWMAGREDSPWYPTARLFRQPAPGAWDATIGKVGAALNDFRA
jgi:tetratricopeptide (TPR) repeat protein